MAPAGRIATLKVLLTDPKLQTARVDATAEVAAGTVYRVAVLVAVVAICPKTLYIVAIIVFTFLLT